MKLGALGAGLLVVLACATALGAQSKVPGVTDAEVVIGLTTPLSGPAAAWGTTALAAEAWAKHVNEQGGVHGRKIRTVLKDDGYVPGRAVANVTEMKDTVFAIVGLLGSAILHANKDLVAEARMPTIYPLGDVQIWARQPKDKLRSVFVVYPDYLDEGEFLVKQAVKVAGARKVAIFYQNDEFGKGYVEGVKRGVKALGGQVSLVGEVPYELQDREMGTHALKVRDSGADVVIPASTTTHGANLIREMAKIGYRPKIMAPFPLGDRQTMFRLLGELWEGAYYTYTTAVPGEPPADRVLEILLKQDPKLKGRESFALGGTPGMMLAIEGLKRAGRNLTRESFIEAMEGLKDWTAEDLLAPVSFAPNRRHGVNGVRLMRAKKAADTSFELVTGWQIFPPHF